MAVIATMSEVELAFILASGVTVAAVVWALKMVAAARELIAAARDESRAELETLAHGLAAMLEATRTAGEWRAAGYRPGCTDIIVNDRRVASTRDPDDAVRICNAVNEARSLLGCDKAVCICNAVDEARSLLGCDKAATSAMGEDRP
jgi:hypothetical protein